MQYLARATALSQLCARWCTLTARKQHELPLLGRNCINCCGDWSGYRRAPLLATRTARAQPNAQVHSRTTKAWYCYREDRRRYRVHNTPRVRRNRAQTTALCTYFVSFGACWAGTHGRLPHQFNNSIHRPPKRWTTPTPAILF